jgi:hypothetical protein
MNERINCTSADAETVITERKAVTSVTECRKEAF